MVVTGWAVKYLNACFVKGLAITNQYVGRQQWHFDAVAQALLLLLGHVWAKVGDQSVVAS